MGASQPVISQPPAPKINPHTRQTRRDQGSWEDLSPSCRKIWVCPSSGNSARPFLPLRWMEGKRSLAKLGESGEGRERRRERGKSTGGGGRPGYRQMGARDGGVGEGGCWRGPAPGSWDLPPTGPGNSLSHSLGRAGQGRAGPSWQGRGRRHVESPWKVQTHP